MKTLHHSRPLVIALALGVLSSAALGQSAYEVTDLGVFPGLTHSWATGINAAGQIVGLSSSADRVRTRAFLFSEGRMVDLGFLPGGSTSMALGINASGQVVGSATTANESQLHAFLHTNGTMRDLGSLSGLYSVARAINAAGQVVGESIPPGKDLSEIRAVLFANGQVSELGTLGGAMSVATGINDSGQIVGVAATPLGFVGEVHAFLYANGRMTDLGTLGGSTSRANGINASGQIVGASKLGGAGSPGALNDEHAFLFSNNRMTDLGTLAPYLSSEAMSINATGQVVGSVFDPKDGNSLLNTNQRAFLYSGGQMVDLNTLLVGARGWILLGATAINDSGKIAGFGINPTGEIRGFLLSPSSLPPDPVVVVIIRAPASQSVTLGSPATFSVTAAGSNLSFQWKKNGAAIPGATGATYVIASAAPGNAGSYSVVVTGGGSSVESGGATLTVLFPPVAVRLLFGAQPVPVEVHQGGSVTFSVGVTGGAPTYQWRKNGVALAGATNATYVITSATASDAGSYSVVVGVGGSSNESGRANLTVLVPVTLSIVTHPASAEISPGASVTFSVVATGDTLTYQWRKNGAAIAGATRTTYIISSAAAGDMGFYSVVARSGDTSVESAAAILTVGSAQAYSFTTLAGAARSRGSTDGTGSAARFNFPSGVAIDGGGNLIVTDATNYTVRRITPTGEVTTLAGLAGSQGTADGIGSAARFESFGGVAVDGAGNILVSAGGSVRKITPNGVVTTVSTRFVYSAGVAVDGGGNIFRADTHAIFKIAPDGSVTEFAGSRGNSGTNDGAGSAARFNWPRGLAVAGNGDLIVADSGNSTIRRVTPAAVVSTLAGAPGSRGALDGTGSAARFNSPYAVAIDGNGSIFVADSSNQLLRKIAPNGVVTTLGGKEDVSASVDGIGTEARFGYPLAVAVDRSGTLFVTDASTHVIRKGVPPLPASRLMNISTRGSVPAGGALTPGFVLRGSGAKSLVVRAVGPTLARFGVDGVLTDPVLDLIRAGTSTILMSNDNWGSGNTGTALVSATAAVGAFALESGTRDAALLTTLNTAATGPGYSARITAASPAAAGLVLAEVYDADAPTAPVQIVNVSTLGSAGTGANNLVSGFVIAGTSAKQLLIRAVGPGLAAFGVTDALVDPQLSITPLGQSLSVASNDNWDNSDPLTAAFVQAGAFALTTGSKDAALVLRLPPGGYTVTVSGAGTTTGTALVEIYDLDP